MTLPPGELIAAGHDLINASVFPTYYAEDIGPAKARSNMQLAYEAWDVTQFCGPSTTGDVRTPCYTVTEGTEHIRGATINVWGPTPETPEQIASGITSRLAVIAQKTWESPLLTPAYDEFVRIWEAAGFS